MNEEIQNPDYKIVSKNHCECSRFESGRRDFLSRASCAVLALLAASGISFADALSFPVFITSADALQGTEHSYPLPAADTVSIDQVNQVILVRIGNHVYALSLACPHQRILLLWQPQDRRFQCPRHHAKFNLDGIYISGHKTRNIDRFALRLENDKVVVDVSKLYYSDRQKNEWESAVLVL